MIIKFNSKLLSCPVCKNKKIKHHQNIERENYSFSTDKCENCGFIFMNPQYDTKTIKSFYDKQYYNGSSSYSYIDERVTYQYSSYVWDARIRVIKKYAKKGPFLDIGCSFGGFLSRAMKFYKPYGVDLSPYASVYAKKTYNINVHTGTLGTSKFPQNYFSVITMIEMIEHDPNPMKTITKCRMLLKKGGLLVIQTADMGAWQAIKKGSSYHYYLPGHLSYFSESTLIYALKKAGFSKIHVYRPVDFGLLPKLLKARGNFKSIVDYYKLITMTVYHVKGFFSYNDRRLTSSMVVYATV